MSSDTVHFNLDTVQRPESFELFAFTLGDRRMTISDPAEMDYQDLLACDSPTEFLRYCMSQEDRDFLAEQRLPGWRLGRLVEAFLEHYKAAERTPEKDRKRLGF